MHGLAQRKSWDVLHVDRAFAIRAIRELEAFKRGLIETLPQVDFKDGRDFGWEVCLEASSCEKLGTIRNYNNDDGEMRDKGKKLTIFVITENERRFTCF